MADVKKPLVRRVSSFDISGKTSKSKPTGSGVPKQVDTKVTVPSYRSGYNVRSVKEKEKTECDKVAEKALERLSKGDLSDIPKLPHSVVRIFLSSTFSDMRAERNTLAREVYPKLKELCSSYDLDFQVVDMRWGITEDSQNDHSVEQICLTEIENCQNVSLGPKFVLIAGDRYGFRPLPTEIDSKEFDYLCKLAEQNNMKNTDILRSWYILDENALPPVYVLQPIRSKFQFFGDYSPGCEASRKKDAEMWHSTFSLLQNILREAADVALKAKQISTQQHHQYFLSVTEQEINKGILEASDPSSHAIVYHRQLNSLTGDALCDSVAKRYIDVRETDNGSKMEIDKVIQALKEDLMQNKIPSALKTKSIHSFLVPWKAGGISPSNHKEHAMYLNTFCSSFVKDVADLINLAINSSKKVRIRGYKLYLELLHHSNFCKTKCETFCGQEQVLVKVKDYLLDGSKIKPLVIHAHSGAGKTSIMAMVMNSLTTWLGKEPVGIIRFLGTSPNSVDIYDVLRSVCGQLAFISETLFEPVGYKTMKSLMGYVPRFLRKVANKLKIPIVILLDSLDQLSVTNDSFSCNWLPVRLPPNVKIIVSTLSEKYEILDNLKHKLQDESCFCEIPALSYDTANAIVNRYLQLKRRTLTQHQRQALMLAFSESPGPLFLKLLLDEAIKWKSYTEESQIDLANSVQVAISTLFKRLETKFGQIVTSHALGYITIGLNGLSEIEIEDALSCDDEALDDVYRYHNPPVDGIVRIPSVLWARIRFEIKEYLVERLSEGKHTLNWYHRQFIETTMGMYATGHQAMKLHSVLAETFIADEGVKRDITLSRRKITIQNADRQVTPKPVNPENIRKLRCLPFHLINAGSCLDEYTVKDSCFCNFKFMASKLSSFSSSTLLEELEALLNQKEDDEIWLLRQFFRVCKVDLSQPAKLAFNLLSYINAGSKQKSLLILLKAAREYLASSIKPSLTPLYPVFNLTQNTESTLEVSFKDCSDILSDSSDMILFRQESRQTDEKRKEGLTLYNVTTESLQTLNVPVHENRNKEFHLDGNRLIYTSASHIYTFDTETSSTSSVSFESMMYSREVISVPCLTTLSRDATHFVVLFENADLLVLETSGMTKITQFSCEEPVEDIIGVLCTNIENLRVIVIGKKKMGDRSPPSGFIKLFYPDQPKEQRCKSISDSFTKGLFDLSGSGDMLIGAVNRPNKSKIISLNLETFVERSLADIGPPIVQMETSKTEDLTTVLTENGSLFIIRNGGVVKTGLGIDHTISCFGAFWEQNHIFLGDCQGNVFQHDVQTGKNVKVLKAKSERNIKRILPFSGQLVLLDKKNEISLWTIPASIGDSSKSKMLSNVNISNAILTHEVCSFDVNSHSLAMACKDKIVRLWSLDDVCLQKQFDFGIIAGKCHFVDDSFIFGLEQSTGTMKMASMVDGSFIYGNLKFMCLDYTLSKDFKTVYALSKGPSGDLGVLVLSPRLGVIKKQFSLKQGLSFVKIDISVSLNERYMILRSKCSENEISSIKGASNAHKNLRHQYKFSAVDLEQANGGVTTCYRYMTKTPLLGEVAEPYQNNSMMVASGRNVLFWDIPTGKCINRVHKAQKKDMMSRLWWIGSECEGTSFAVAQSRDGNAVGVGSEDGYFFIYNANTGMPLGNCVPASKHNAPVTKVVCSPDSNWFVSACENRILKLWDSKSAVEVFSIRLDADIQQIKFSRNSQHLLVCKGNRMLMYKLNPGK